jgi:hypothetical protein
MGTLPVFGALEGSLKSGARGVQVIEKKDVGDFETTTLTATSSEELVKWLKDHQYNYSEKDQENFDYYVQKKNSYFVALKIKMDSFNGSLKPIGFVFDTNVPVIAMKISASDMKAMKYTLYTAGESMFFVPGTPLYNSKKVLKKDIDANPGIKNYIAANDWVTQAIVTMDPSRIQEDLIITEAVEPEPVAGKTIILNPGMIPSAAGIVLGVSTTNKKNISVMKNAPTLTPMPPTSTPTPATVTEKTQQQIISHRYTSVVFWVIIIVGLIAEADANATADAEKRAVVEAQNIADQTVYAAEKALREHGDKAGDAVKKDIQEKIDALKAARNGSDKDLISSATQALNQSMSAIGEAMQKSQEAAPKPENDSSSEGDSK